MKVHIRTNTQTLLIRVETYQMKTYCYCTKICCLSIMTSENTRKSIYGIRKYHSQLKRPENLFKNQYTDSFDSSGNISNEILTVIVQKYVACWWWFHFDNHHYRNWSCICKIYEIKVGISIGVIDSNLSQFQVDDIGNLKSSYIKEKNRKNMSL